MVVEIKLPKVPHGQEGGRVSLSLWVLTVFVILQLGESQERGGPSGTGQGWLWVQSVNPGVKCVQVHALCDQLHREAWTC